MVMVTKAPDALEKVRAVLCDGKVLTAAEQAGLQWYDIEVDVDGVELSRERGGWCPPQPE
jgi:hypothetical protein